MKEKLNLNESENKIIDKPKQVDGKFDVDFNLLISVEMNKNYFSLLQKIFKTICKEYKVDAEFIKDQKYNFKDFTLEEMMIIYDHIINEHNLLTVFSTLEQCNLKIDEYKEKIDEMNKKEDTEYMKKCNDYLAKNLLSKDLSTLIVEGKKLLVNIAYELQIHLEKILENFPKRIEIDSDEDDFDD